MQILVNIANYGAKNMKHLAKLLDAYRSMPFDIDITINSNIPKDLGDDVEVFVGLPSKNPWSLPFAHHKLFVDRADDYDLFIYSEDDTLLTERNGRAFLKATEVLPEDHIAGFIRYEVGPDGTRYYSTIHAHYFWDIESLRVADDQVFARYTNDHAACYILTRAQLKKAIASGGYSMEPYEGRYDMLVSAATDPYAKCGLKKVVGISNFEDFCLPHLPNVYIGKIGVEATEIHQQIEKLKSLAASDETREPLFKTRTGLNTARWDKRFYEPCRRDILELAPAGAKKILSVGCGSGDTEAKLTEMGKDVTTVPLDCIIQISAERKGLRTLPPDFKLAGETLGEERFDCLILLDVLHLVPDPMRILNDYLKFLTPGGSVIISVPNFDHVFVLRRKLAGEAAFQNLNDAQAYEKYGSHSTTRKKVDEWMRHSGLRVVRRHRHVNGHYGKYARYTLGLFNGKLREKITLLAQASGA